MMHVSRWANPTPRSLRPCGSVRAAIAASIGPAALERAPELSGDAADLQAASPAAYPSYCKPEYISQALLRFQGSPDEGGNGSVSGLLAYYRRLGCTQIDLDEGVVRALGGRESFAGMQQGDGFGSWPVVVEPLAPQFLAAQLTVASVAALAALCWKDRPVGWVASRLVEVRPSPIAGNGLFAKVDIPRGTPLGAYPGRVRTAEQMRAKAAAAPKAAGYCFLTSDGTYLDPTDAKGEPSAWPAPGMPWPWPTCTELAFANEPPPGVGGTSCFVEDGAQPSELLFVANRDIRAGEEIFIDYGRNYDRSTYRSSS